jgi:hypothetical protein
LTGEDKRLINLEYCWTKPDFNISYDYEEAGYSGNGQPKFGEDNQPSMRQRGLL